VAQHFLLLYQPLQLVATLYFDVVFSVHNAKD
jgi:hypothetical protein